MMVNFTDYVQILNYINKNVKLQYDRFIYEKLFFKCIIKKCNFFFS